MKILHIQKISGIAGSEIYLLNLLPALRKRGIEVEFLTLYSKDKAKEISFFNDKLTEQGIRVQSFEISNIPRLRELKNIFIFINRGKFSLIHTHLLFSDIIIVLIKLIFDRSLVVVSTKHGYQESYTVKYGFKVNSKVVNAYRILSILSEKLINRSFAISKGVYNLYIGLRICKTDKLDIIHHGFDYTDNSQIKEELRFGDPQVTIVGRLTRYKGHEFALGCIKKLKEKYKNIKLVIVGKGELEQKLKTVVEEEKISDFVVFAGFQPNTRDFMASSDVVLIPSISEGFGLVVLEAMSVKIPIVAFKVPSFNEIIENDVSGYLAKPYSLDDFTDKVDSLLSNPDKRISMGNSGFYRLKELFSSNRMTTNTIEFYKKALNLW